MSAITTAAAGDWSATGTWTGGVVPGNGDTVTLNHAVTVSDARTVGTSPAAGSGTDAIRCNAVLTIANGGFLKVRGDIGLNNVGMTVAAGGILEFDASQAGTPSTALYVCKGSNASGDVNAVITVTGTSGNHAIIRSNSGGANGRFTTDGNGDGGAFVATFCDFLRIGDSSHPSINFYLRAGDVFNLTDCTLDACGQIGDHFGVGINAQGQFTLLRVRMFNTPGNCLGIPADARSGSGVRSITFCAFDGDVLLYRGDEYTVTDTILHYYDTTGGAVAVWERNVIVFDPGSSGDYSILGLFKDCYCLWLGQPTNPHYLTTASMTTRITGCIFDCPDGDGNQQNGDTITFNAPGSPQTITVDHNIGLHVNNQNVGTMLSCLGGSNLTLIAEHNTYHGGQGIYLGETYAGYAGMVSSCKSNLAFAKTGATAYIISGDAGVATDVVSAANADYNGVWHPAGTNGYTTNLSFSSGSPGAHDVGGDPGFVDVDRNIKTWDASLGGPGTVANALAEIGLGNRTVQSLLDYVRAGFQPTASAFQAAHDSVSPSLGWIGAVAGPAATSEQEGSRARNDDGSESTATWKAAQDTDVTLANGDAFRFRGILNATGDLASKRIGVGYKVNGGQLREVH